MAENILQVDEGKSDLAENTLQVDGLQDSHNAGPTWRREGFIYYIIVYVVLHYNNTRILLVIMLD